jgi:protein gp37
MGDGTHIEWTDATWQIVTGCSIKSPGCTNCYAMRLAGTRLRNHSSRAGLTREVNGNHIWTGEVRFNEQWLDQPLRWKEPRDIFVAAHGDIGHEGVTDEMLDRIFAAITLAHWHRYQILTKRPERLLAYLRSRKTMMGNIGGMAQAIMLEFQSRTSGGVKTTYPLKAIPFREETIDRFHGGMPNVWIGASAERQQEADERRPHLEALARMGWNTWVSYEPALGSINWPGWEFIKWMVSGGESGPGARPSHPDWHRATRDWCAANGVPYFFKQWGSWAPYDRGRNDSAILAVPKCLDSPMQNFGKKLAGSLLDGREHKAMPA